MIKQTNDTLLCHLIATDQMLKEITPKHKTDEILVSPKQIKVGANEIIYIHFIHVDPTPSFELTIATPTRVIGVNETTTINGSFNTIIRGMGTIQFFTSQDFEYTVQFVRVEF